MGFMMMMNGVINNDMYVCLSCYVHHIRFSYSFLRFLNSYYYYNNFSVILICNYPRSFFFSSRVFVATVDYYFYLVGNKYSCREKRNYRKSKVIYINISM